MLRVIYFQFLVTAFLILCRYNNIIIIIIYYYVSLLLLTVIYDHIAYFGMLIHVPHDVYHNNYVGVLKETTII